MAFLRPNAPGAVLTAQFNTESGSFEAEQAQFASMVAELQSKLSFDGYLRCERREAKMLLVEIIPARAGEPAPAARVGWSAQN